MISSRRGDFQIASGGFETALLIKGG